MKKLTKFDVGPIYLISYVLQLVLQTVVLTAFQARYGDAYKDRYSWTYAIVFVNGLSFLAAALGYSAAKKIKFFSEVGIKKKPDAKMALLIVPIAVFTIFSTMPLANWFVELFGKLGYDVASSSITMPTDVFGYILMSLFLSLVPAVCEEIMFRGAIAVGLRRQGAAVATVIAQGISVVLCILYVMRRVPLLLPARKHWAVGQHLYWELFSQSISMGLMSSIVSAGSVVLQYGINGLGTLTIAGHTAARKLFSFTNMPLISMANAGSTFVSQNRGAGQPERVRRGMRIMYLCSVVIMVADIVLMQLFARQLVQLISGSTAPLVLENGARYLMWNAPFYAVLGVLLCTRYALQSLGQKVLPLFSSVIELVGKVIFVLVFIPRYAYNAVILCEPIIWCFMALYLVAVYLHEPFVFPKKKK